MWILFGLLAIATTLVNLCLFCIGKDYKLAMALGLSFTALTLCADYSLLNMWIDVEDWAAIEDVVPGMSRALWVLTTTSIVLNIAPIFLEKMKPIKKGR